MAHKPLPGYNRFANKYAGVIDINGPASYVSPQVIYAKSLGIGGFDFVIPMNLGGITVVADQLVVAKSISGTYYVEILLPTTLGGGNAAGYVNVKWYVTATGVEAGAIDLSAEYFRMFYLGV